MDILYLSFKMANNGVVVELHACFKELKKIISSCQKSKGASTHIIGTTGRVDLSEGVVLVNGIAGHHQCHFESISRLIYICLRGY